MSQGLAPSVFISSTCYDLNQIRADLKQFIDKIKYNSVLSEFDSFPVDPSKNIIENCRSSVQKHADIFVLIVGGMLAAV